MNSQLNRCRSRGAVLSSVLWKATIFPLFGVLAAGCPPSDPVTVPERDEVPPSVGLELFGDAGGKIRRLPPAFGDDHHRITQTGRSFAVAGSAKDSGGVHRLEILTTNQLDKTGSLLNSIVLDRGQAVESIRRQPVVQLPAGETAIFYAEAEDFHANKSVSDKYLVHSADRCEYHRFKLSGYPGYPPSYEMRTESGSQLLQVMNLSSLSVNLTYIPDTGGATRVAVIPGRTVSKDLMFLPGRGTWTAVYRNGKEEILVCFK